MLENIFLNFEKQALTIQSKVAVRSNEGTISYSVLYDRSSQLSSYFERMTKGQSEPLIVLHMYRSIDFITCVLACLRSGIGFVPLDPDLPDIQKDHILQDTKPSILVTNQHAGELTSLPLATHILSYPIESLVKTNTYTASTRPFHKEGIAYILYTSGSTGRPKGVVIPQRSLCNFLNSIAKIISLNSNDRFLFSTTPSFDISILEYLAPLVTGGTVIIVPKGLENQGTAFFTFIRQQKPTIIQGTPLMWTMLFTAGWSPESCQKALCGGDVLPNSLFNKFKRMSIPFWNLYGPTETTIWSTYAPFYPDDVQTDVHLGKPIDETAIILQEKNFLPSKFQGELCLSGLGLARGYWNRADLTAAAFIPTFHQHKKNVYFQRAYRTGDLVKKNTNTTLTYVGRVDNQVKVRGYRVELEEIENYLNQSLLLIQGIAQVETNSLGSQRLVAFLQCKDKAIEKKQVISQLQKELQRSLPAYKLPQKYYFVDSIPKSSRGKVDRKHITLHTHAKNQHATLQRPPRSEIEKALLAVCCEILGSPTLSVEDNLFDWGLDSLSSLKIVLAMRKWGIHLREKDIFLHSSIHELYTYIRQRSHQDFQPRSIPPVNPRPNYIPISSPQKLIWNMERFFPTQGVYTLPYAFNVVGKIDMQRFEMALRHLTQRHEILRTVFVKVEESIVQKILPDIELSSMLTKKNLSDIDKKLSIVEYLTREAKRPFDLASLPLLRIQIISCDNNRSIVFFHAHHIITDEWSTAILLRDLSALYRESHDLPPLPIQYADYSVWQEKHLPAMAPQRDYWIKHLAAISQAPLFNTGRRSQSLGYSTRCYSITLPEDRLPLMKKMGSRTHTSQFMMLAACLGITLYRYTYQKEIIIGTPVVNRNYSELKDLAGLFINLLALKHSLSANDTFQDVLTQTKRRVLSAYENQEIPFDKVVKSVVQKTELSKHPLFQVMLILENQSPSFALCNTQIEEIDLTKEFSNPSLYDITLWSKETKNGLELRFEYAKELFSNETICQIATSFSHALDTMIEAPQTKISQFYSPAAHPEKNHSGTSLPLTHSDDLLERVQFFAVNTPEKICAIFQNQMITYKGLQQQVEHLAKQLLSIGVSLESSIAVIFERSLEYLVAILAIFRCGATYVPIDPSLPTERISVILRKSRTAAILTKKSFLALSKDVASPHSIVLDIEQLLRSEAKNYLLPELSTLPINRLAYIIFTSGSTGNPKGVMVEYEGMLNHLRAKEIDLAIEKNDVIAQTATQIFDISVWQFLMGIFSGGTTWICSTEDFWSPDTFFKSLATQRITVAETVPSHMNMLLQSWKTSPVKLPRLRWVLSTGEPLHVDHVKQWFHAFPSIPLMNAYGPTECSDDVTHFPISSQKKISGTTIPITGTVINTSLYFLDPFFYQAEESALSELAIGGVGVGRGYIDEPKKTAATFMPNPFSSLKGSRMYLTGDLIQKNDGNIFYQGRIDKQIKLRGYRIEPREIEETIEMHPCVEQALVLVKKCNDGKERLIAYIVTSSSTPLQALTETIKQNMTTHLPPYMHPSIFIPLSTFPLMKSGKVAVDMLPSPDFIEETKAVLPRNVTEKAIAQIFSQLLQKEAIGIYDDFFALGCDSMMAIKAASDIGMLTQKSITVFHIFKYPTIQQLGNYLDAEKTPTVNTESGVPTLFLIHASDGITMEYQKLKPFIKDVKIVPIQNPNFGTNLTPFSSIEEMAKLYCQEIEAMQTDGSYFLGGWSFGGVVAFEIAKQLKEKNKAIGHVFLIDSMISSDNPSSCAEEEIREILGCYGIFPASEQFPHFLQEVKHNNLLLNQYKPRYTDIALTFFRERNRSQLDDTIWSERCENFSSEQLAASHYHIFSCTPSLKKIAKIIKKTMTPTFSKSLIANA